jgi:hypothetical protein
MKVVYGFFLLALVFLGCFGYEFFLTTQLQSQVQTLENQNNELTSPKVVVLAYSWTDNNLYSFISVNCTLLNVSPNNATEVGVYVKAQIGTHIETQYWGIGMYNTPGTLEPWHTINEYNLELDYNSTEGNINVVWLEPTWLH